jgi:outer membrane protein assembly factor BamB
MFKTPVDKSSLKTLSFPVLLAFTLIASILPLQVTAQNAESVLAHDILKQTGIKGGLIVHLNCGDGKLTAALRANESCIVHGLDTNPDNIELARKHIRSLGPYGPVSVELWKDKSLPYADNLVNLLITDQPLTIPMAEVIRVLCPSGVAYIKQADKWIKKVKPRPDDIDQLTHFLHGPDNNAVAGDTRVGPPRQLQWKSDPLWCRSHDGLPSSVALVISSKGRLFSVIDEGLIGQPRLPYRWTIVARDAFNGTLLWKRPLPARISQKALVAVEDKLYLAAGRRAPLQIIDAATGKTLGTFEDTEGSDEIICIEDTIIFHRAAARRQNQGNTDSIIAMSIKDEKTLWRTQCKQLIRHTLTAADDKVCYHNANQIVCLDINSGDVLWQQPCRADKRGGLLMMYKGVALFTAPGGVQAFAADTGEHLWKGPRVNNRLSMFGADGLVWLTDIQEHGRTFLWTPAPVLARGYEPGTGQVKRTVEVPRLITPGHHLRCYPSKATQRYLLLPKRGVEFVDLKSENHMRHDWLRGPCGHGVLPANGLLYTPPHQCFCYAGVKLAGFNALCPDIDNNADSSHQTEHEKLERGPAYDSVNRHPESDPSQSDWPTYRHDSRRSGRAGCELPVNLQPLWEQKLDGQITQPVVADRKIFVAGDDAHTVWCLDADTGSLLWDYTTGARIDSSPTVYRGLVLFGSNDGWVYCLRAADGRLAWRFRAAPGHRRIVTFGQLESTWPVHGSVLVQDGVAYCTAGRSSFLEGGVRVYGLDPATGKVLHRLYIESPQPDITRQAGRPFDMEGIRSDILVSDGEDIYMFFLRMAPDLTRKETPKITKLGDREVSTHLMSNAGFLDKSWFDRNFWTYSRRWPGYYFAYNAPKSGQILVFDDERTYGLHVFTERQGHSPRFWPGKDGYELFADTNANRLVLRPTSIGREKGDGFTRTLPPVWSTRIPVRAQAMVLAGRKLYLAGPPDIVPKDDPMASFEGRLGGKLWVVSTKNGEKLTEYELDYLPVFDGIIAAKGRMYIAAKNGRLICMGKKQ